VTLEEVWQVLEQGKWVSKQELREASGLDESILTPIIEFLHRWKFVDIQGCPKFLVRRRPGTISPAKTFELLMGLVDNPSWIGGRKVAERVACRACGGGHY